MKNINDLPDLCLRVILSKLPLKDLLRMDQVCPAWARIQPSACLLRTELSILIGDKPTHLIDDSSFTLPYYDELLENQYALKVASDSQNQLVFDWLDGQSAKLLTRLLPNTATVCIAIRHVLPVISIGEKTWSCKTFLMDQVILLLTKWSLKVQTLKIFIDFDESKCEEKQMEGDLQNLIRTINSCQSLRHLTIKLKNNHFSENSDLKTNMDLPILSRLEEFYLDFQQNMSVVNDSLDRYAKVAPDLRVLAINGMRQDSFDSGALLRYDQKLAEKFTQLPELVFSEANSVMRSFCTRFWRLERLKINLNYQKIYRLTKMLRPMKNLIYLDIKFQVNIDDHVEEPEMSDFELIPQLPSVKIIKIDSYLRSHAKVGSIQWHLMFPNLEIMQYIDFYGGCPICEPKNDLNQVDNNENNPNQEQQINDQQNNQPEIINNPENNDNEEEVESTLDKCLKCALQAWKHCAKLHSVYTGDETCFYVKKRSLHKLFVRD